MQQVSFKLSACSTNWWIFQAKVWKAIPRKTSDD